ncbi:MAG TPA: divalent-cation tolerance protein CutA [Acidimicrobiales bacterium]|nr:divalent-cation tolerance protein CutA [Acidimicrobiales bacterium]
MDGHFQVRLTAPDADEASHLGNMAVESRLAACAQVSGPITSTYWWQGGITSTTEWVCQLKTTAARLTPLIDALRAAHSYDVPEIIATPIVAGDADYLAWIDEETRARQ